MTALKTEISLESSEQEENQEVEPTVLFDVDSFLRDRQRLASSETGSSRVFLDSLSTLSDQTCDTQTLAQLEMADQNPTVEVTSKILFSTSSNCCCSSNSFSDADDKQSSTNLPTYLEPHNIIHSRQFISKGDSMHVLCILNSEATQEENSLFPPNAYTVPVHTTQAIKAQEGSAFLRAQFTTPRYLNRSHPQTVSSIRDSALKFCAFGMPVISLTYAAIHLLG